jgi:hypothetical protein
LREIISTYLQSRKADIEKKLHRKIIIRVVRKPDHSLKGKIYCRHDDIIVEYNDRVPGFFWHEDIIGMLLSKVEEGAVDLEIREESDDR